MKVIAKVDKKMGQAKKRGTFEQRLAESRDRKAISDAVKSEKEKLELDSLTPEQQSKRRKAAQTLAYFSVLASSLNK